MWCHDDKNTSDGYINNPHTTPSALQSGVFVITFDKDMETTDQVTAANNIMCALGDSLSGETKDIVGYLTNSNDDHCIESQDLAAERFLENADIPIEFLDESTNVVNVWANRRRTNDAEDIYNIVLKWFTVEENKATLMDAVSDLGGGATEMTFVSVDPKETWNFDAVVHTRTNGGIPITIWSEIPALVRIAYIKNEDGSPPLPPASVDDFINASIDEGVTKTLKTHAVTIAIADPDPKTNYNYKFDGETLHEFPKEAANYTVWTMVTTLEPRL